MYALYSEMTEITTRQPCISYAYSFYKFVKTSSFSSPQHTSEQVKLV